MLPLGILENINHLKLQTLTPQERQDLCGEIRQFLISHVSKTGGHVASNLGVVELTVAIETVFHTEIDRLVFDVGHQSYVHKLLTGRQADFRHLRQFGGIAGFPKPSESNTDAFVAGHASSSVSIALGMARARTLQKRDYSVIALIGDGAATGGIAFEGLNDAAVSGEPMIVILNDNAMSIDQNVGGMASHLRRLRTKERYLGMKNRSKNFLSKLPGGKFVARTIHKFKDWLRRHLIPTTIFESMGFTYFGPVDGHDTEHLIYLLRMAKQMNRPVLLHVITEKGRGYAPAAEQPTLFHGIGKFDPETGAPNKSTSPSFSSAFGNTMCQLAGENEKLCAITAAMPGGTGLEAFKELYPERTFDVGIAEEHAVSMAGGLAKQGMIPVVALYSTFLQRAYDMILQDVCMLGLHVVFAVDRAGLVGEDGETHHGVFDVGFLRQAPGMRILCPASLEELSEMLRWSVNDQTGPVAIRYPRGGNGAFIGISRNSVEVCRDGEDIAIVCYGTMINNTLDAAVTLGNNGICAKVIRLTEIAPLPVQGVIAAVGNIKKVFVVEECTHDSGIVGALSLELSQLRNDISVKSIDLGDHYVPHGAVSTLYEHYGLSADAIASRILEEQNLEN